MTHAAKFAIVLATALLGGCGAGLRPAAQAEYDFGPAPQATAAGIAPRVSVSAPSWLADTAMHYRLLYAEPAQRRQYAGSRWVAPPAELLAHQLGRRLAGADFSARCRLTVELVELEQVFERSDASHLRLAVRTTLTSAANAAPLQTDIDFVEAAPTADARGGVAAAGLAVERLGVRLADWLAGAVPAAGCKR